MAMEEARDMKTEHTGSYLDGTSCSVAYMLTLSAYRSHGDLCLGPTGETAVSMTGY